MRKLVATALLVASAVGCTPDQVGSEDATSERVAPVTSQLEPAKSGGNPPECSDPTGDAASSDGRTPSSIPPGMDLTHARVERTAEGLAVQIGTQPPVPATTVEPSGLFWSVDIWPADNGSFYQLRIALDGDQWTVGVFEYVVNSTVDLDITPTVSDGRLEVTFPLDVLTGLPDPFLWSVITEWGDDVIYNDNCPGGGGPIVEMEDMVPYPG